MKDLIRGTVVTDLKDLFDAYQHFKKLEGVKIIEIKDLDKMYLLQNITVNFVFEDRFVGEMQFRFCKEPNNYYANHFLYEIARSRMKLEVL